MMKYKLCINARSAEDVSIAQKHANLVAGLAAVPGAWGLASAEHAVPDPGRELSAHFPLGKSLRTRGVRGFASYRFRGGLRDHSSCDDYIDLDFNPERVDFGALIESLPQYIAAFVPYFAYIADEEFGFLDFNRSRNMDGTYPFCAFTRFASWVAD